MFSTTISTYVRDALALIIAFLTLEDGYEPDWALPSEEYCESRPPACEGRVRQPCQSFVDSQWISA